MRIESLLLMIALAFMTIGLGCQSNSTEAAAPNAPAAIEGIAWRLVEVGGQPAEPVPADDRAASFRLDAADKRVSGYGGVNQLTGPYQLNGKALKFGMLAMTRRAGPEALMRQESAVSRTLDQTVSWRSVGQDEIELLDAASKPLARFKRAAR